jgi:sec-independent protein translocase protein TatA
MEAVLLAFLGNLHFGEIMIIVLVILLLFGASKIPQLMRSMGSGISQFKKGIKEGEKDDQEEKKAEDAKKDEAKAGESEKK